MQMNKLYFSSLPIRGLDIVVRLMLFATRSICFHRKNRQSGRQASSKAMVQKVRQPLLSYNHRPTVLKLSMSLRSIAGFPYVRRLNSMGQLFAIIRDYMGVSFI